MKNHQKFWLPSRGRNTGTRKSSRIRTKRPGYKKPEMNMAPLNASFMDWVHQDRKKPLQVVEKGHIPSPLDLSHLSARLIDPPASEGSLPPAFDLRTARRLTPVKDQGDCGDCWAFACLAALESHLLPLQFYDFSERHMIHRLSSACIDGFDWLPHHGGNHLMAAAYLARMDGPVLQQKPPCSLCGIGDRLYHPVKHLKSEVFLSARSSPLDNGGIKQALLDNGAVYTSIYLHPQHYNPANASYYYSGTEQSNHDLCLVGWEDHFPPTLFRCIPPGEGAYIARNSFGTEWGEGGYFYISYYDSRIGEENAVFREVDDIVPGLVMYQYDPLGWIRSIGFGDTCGWCANVFTAFCDTELLGVSTYAASPGTGYQGGIYLDPPELYPQEGRLSSAFQGQGDFAGYFTIELPEPVWVKKGQRFSVVLQLDTPAYYCPIPVQTRIDNYSSRSQGRPGQGFISGDGLIYEDLYFNDPYANLCVKVFGVGCDG